MSNSWEDRVKRYGIQWVCVVLISVAFARTAEAAPDEASLPFRAGAATSNITPWLGASMNGYFQDRRAAYIHDELHARCLVLDDGRTRLAIVVCDLCML